MKLIPKQTLLMMGLMVFVSLVGIMLILPPMVMGNPSMSVAMSNVVASQGGEEPRLSSRTVEGDHPVKGWKEWSSVEPSTSPNELGKKQLKSVALVVQDRPPMVDLDSRIGAFPFKNQNPPAFPHWRLVPERNSIELYAPREFISRQVFSLATFAGDIDRQSKKGEVASKGQIKGFVYAPVQVVEWLNAKYNSLDSDERRLVKDLMDLGVLIQSNGGFVWNKKFDGWPINAYSSAGVFRHERVHVLWISHPEFAEYFIRDWEDKTTGMSRQAKVGFVLDQFKVVPYNKPPGYAWWNTVYNQVGEENVVNEFTAHSIEKLPDWRGRTLAIAM